MLHCNNRALPDVGTRMSPVTSPVSTLTTTHRGHRIEVERFEWGYAARIRTAAGRGKVTMASPTAFRALVDAMAIVDEWTASNENVPSRF